ncbi:DUF4350 domain-containing protein [Phenylobacterium sp.]|uniref:DUF4350 domain-containing protein n=1 Tax=Phenylobacterium sp. TaxID=1871053 RepID=UPI0035AF9804
MSALADAQPKPPAFSPRTVLALVLVGVLSFSALAVLSAYAPDLRAGLDPGAHALSSSAVGYRGATVMLEARNIPAVVSRTTPRGKELEGVLLVLTPDAGVRAQEITAFPAADRTLIVLPKWSVQRDPLRPGQVRKAGVASPPATQMLRLFSRTSELNVRPGVSRPQLRGAPGGYMAGTFLPLDAIDRLQTLSGPGWDPVLVDEQGRAVLARSKARPETFVLSDPDLLNNQGIARFANARAGMAVLDSLRTDRGVRFDVTLNGIKRGRGLGRLMLEPPWLAATLCAVAAAVLMGLHALARFGPAQVRGRAFALGKAALVDNSAGLVRMARRETEMGPAYVALSKALIARAAGADRNDDTWLTEVARLRGAATPAELEAEMQRATTRETLAEAARRLHDWRLEMTRERR